MTALYAAAALAVLALIALLTVRKVKNGASCCGGGHAQAARKVKVADRNRAHYPFCYVLSVDGMHCASCVRSIENAFAAREGLWAEASLEKKQATVRAKQELSEKELSQIVAGAGFTMLGIKETLNKSE